MLRSRWHRLRYPAYSYLDDPPQTKTKGLCPYPRVLVAVRCSCNNLQQVYMRIGESRSGNNQQFAWLWSSTSVGCTCTGANSLRYQNESWVAMHFKSSVPGGGSNGIWHLSIALRVESAAQRRHLKRARAQPLKIAQTRGALW